MTEFPGQDQGLPPSCRQRDIDEYFGDDTLAEIACPCCGEMECECAARARREWNEL